MKIETLKLDDILKYDQPTKYIVTTDNYNNSFSTPVLTAGKSFLLGYTDDENGIFDNLPAIIFDDFTTSFHYVDFPFKVKSSAMKILTPRNSEIYIKYVYYRMFGLKIDTDLHKRYWISKFSQLKIPLPPLKTQERIAEILDHAAALRDRTAQLLKEYDLLAQSIFLEMFGDPVRNPKGWEFKKLEMLTSKLGDGLHGTPQYDDNGEYFFVNGNNLVEGKIFISSNTKRVSKAEFLKHKKELNKSTMFVSINGTIGNVAFYDFEKIILGKSACYFNIREELINSSFLYRVIHSPYFLRYATGLSTGSTIKNVSLKTMRNFPVPYPPLQLQNQFAEKITLIEKQKELAKQELKESEDLFNCLLQKAFKGELVNETVT